MGSELAIKVGGVADPSLAGADQIEVHERLGEPTTFRLRYPIDIADADIPRLVDGRLGPGSQVQLIVVVDGAPDSLVKGVVHGQQIHMQHGGASSWVEVIGSDTSITMDREVRSALWADISDSDAVASILGSYSLTPDLAHTSAVHVEAKHTLVQRDTDFRFVRRLARRNGYLFWVTSDPLGIETGHFKRPPVDGKPDIKLAINVAPPNVNSIDLRWDVERPTSTEGVQLDLSNKEDLDGAVAKSPQTALGTLPLAAIASGVRTTHVSAPTDDLGDLKARGEGALVEAEFFVQATGSTTLNALGKLLHAHTLVDLQGLGRRHSGTYLISSVRHLIDPARHVMEFELLRNGWGA